MRKSYNITTSELALSATTDYYPFGMPMPNRQIVGGEQYRYAFQGQEKDAETGMEAFQLRLWDGRIGRWLTTDPYEQYASPYLGMGNNPVNGTDPDGGNFDWIKDLVSGNLIWVDSTGKEALKEAATKFGHRSVLDNSDKGLDKVELVSTIFFTNGSDLSIENSGYLEQIQTEQLNYLSQASAKLNVSMSTLINALNGKVPKFEELGPNRKGIIESGKDFVKGEVKRIALEKYAPKIISESIGFLSSEFLSTPLPHDCIVWLKAN